MSVSFLTLLLFAIVSSATTAPASAQIMINKGVMVSTKINSVVQVNGAYQNSSGTTDDSGVVWVTSDFTNNSGATAGGAGWYHIAGNFTNDGTWVRQTGTVDLNGTSRQYVGGTSITTFYNLQFTNGGAKQLTQKEIVDSNCYFNNGICYTTQPYVLNFTTKGNWINNSSMPTSGCISYVDGPCEKDMNSTTRFWFPVGKSGRANTCAITPSSSTATTFRTEYFNYAYYNTTSKQSPLLGVSKVHYWHGDIMTPTSGGTNGIIRLYWISGDYINASYLSNLSGLVVARWDTLAPNPPDPPPAWVTAGRSAIDPAATYQSGWIESSTVTAAQYGLQNLNRPFTLSTTTADNALPVELGAFYAKQVGAHVKLSWFTYSEIENLGFEIERRREGQDPEVIKSYERDTALLAKAPWGANYETMDEESLAPGPYIYELFQRDKNGIRTRVASRQIEIAPFTLPSAIMVSVYPNPASQNSRVTIALPAKTYVSATLFDMTGHKLLSLLDTELGEGEHLLPLDVSTLANGTYSIVVTTGSERAVRTFVVTH